MLLSHRHHRPIYFHNIHLDTIMNKLHWHNTHAHADAEGFFEPALGGVCMRQPAQRTGKQRAAFAGDGIVCVLDELIVKVSALYIVAIAILNNEQLAIIRVGAVKHFPS